jgi:hypothetical protein
MIVGMLMSDFRLFGLHLERLSDLSRINSQRLFAATSRVFLSLAGDRCNGSTVPVVGAELVERHAVAPGYGFGDVGSSCVDAATDTASLEQR